MTKLGPRSPLYPGCLIATGSVARHVRLKRRRFVSRTGHGGSGAGRFGRSSRHCCHAEKPGLGAKTARNRSVPVESKPSTRDGYLPTLHLRIDLRLVGSTIHPTGVGAVLVEQVRGEKRRGAAKRGPKIVVEVRKELSGARTGIEKRRPAKAVRRVNLLGGGPGEAAGVPPVANRIHFPAHAIPFA